MIWSIAVPNPARRPRVALVADLVDVHHEGHEETLEALELLDGVIVEEERLPIHLDLQVPLQDVRGKQLTLALAPAIEAPQTLEELLGLSQLLALRLDGEILEVVRVEVEAVGLQDAGVGEQHRVPDGELDEDPRVVVLDRPGLPPDRRYQEYAGRDQKGSQGEAQSASGSTHRHGDPIPSARSRFLESLFTGSPTHPIRAPSNDRTI
jgi:hypothetical protein